MLKLKICWVTSRLCLKCYVGHYVNVSNIFCYLILITLNEVCWYKLYVHHFKRIILFYLRIFSYTICLLHHWQNFHSSFNFSLIINQMVDSNVCKFLDVILHCLLNVFFAIKVIFSAIIFSCFTVFKSLHILIMTHIHRELLTRVYNIFMHNSMWRNIKVDWSKHYETLISNIV